MAEFGGVSSLRYYRGISSASGAFMYDVVGELATEGFGW